MTTRHDDLRRVVDQRRAELDPPTVFCPACRRLFYGRARYCSDQCRAVARASRRIARRIKKSPSR